MSRSKRFRVATVVGAFVVTASGVVTAAAVPAPQPAAQGWHATPVVVPANAPGVQAEGAFAAVVSTGPKAAIATWVSYDFENADDAPVLTPIYVWNGTAWHLFAHQPPRAASGLGGVSNVTATSLHNIWFVGQSGTGDEQTYNSTIWHWNGHHWSRVGRTGLPRLARCTNPYDPHCPIQYERVLAVKHHVWVVDVRGRSTTIAQYRSATHRWHVMKTYKGKYDVNAIRGSASSAWIVGRTRATGVHQEAFVVRWNGDRWKRVAMPRQPDGTRVSLTDVAAGSRTTAMAVGTVGTLVGQSRIYRPIALRWNGHHWRTTTVPSSIPDLSTVTGAASGNYWASGRVPDPDDASPTVSQVLYRWSGGAWHTVQGVTHAVSGVRPKARINALAHVAGTRSYWAVGYVAQVANTCDLGGDDDSTACTFGIAVPTVDRYR